MILPGHTANGGWRGERADRRRGRVKGGERVAAVEKRKRAPSSVSVFRAPQQESENRPRGGRRDGVPARPSGESGLAPPSDFSFSAGFLF